MPPTQTTIRGSVGIADRVANIQPQSWRRNIFRIVPIGRSPITGLMDAMGSETITSRVHHWWEMPFQALRGDVTDVHLDPGGTAYVSGGSDGDTLYIHVSADDSALVTKGDTILIHRESNDAKLRADVEAVNRANDATSYLLVKLLEDDTNNDLAAGSGLTFRVTGNAQADHSELPEAFARDPEEFFNYSSILMDAIELDGAELAEMERVDPAKYQRYRMDALERIMMKQEWNFLWGVRKLKTGDNGKQRRMMDGLYTVINREESGNIKDWRSDSDFSGQTWKQGGINWLQDVSEELSRYSSASVKQCFCGGVAWNRINQALEERGHFTLEPAQTRYGIKVRTLIGLNQDWEIIQHPLFTDDPAFRNSMLVTEMGLLKKKVFRGRDLTFIKSTRPRSGAFATNEDGSTWVDGIKEGWAVDCTLEYHNLQAMAWLEGFGEINTA